MSHYTKHMDVFMKNTCMICMRTHVTHTNAEKEEMKFNQLLSFQMVSFFFLPIFYSFVQVFEWHLHSISLLKEREKNGYGIHVYNHHHHQQQKLHIADE